MKKQLIIKVCLLLSFMAVSVNLSAQVPSIFLNPAEKLTEKGFVDKESTFDPAALDSLLKCDEYVMLISSFEGCTPCGWLRTSDVFDTYPITPYYNDMLLGGGNATLPFILPKNGFPTCLYFDQTGEIVAVTGGAGADLYTKLDKIVKEKDTICEYRIDDLSADQVLSFLNLSYKANAASLKGAMEDMCKYATEAMNIYPDFYNRYLLYKYYASINDMDSADKYKALALENLNNRDKAIYKKLVEELNQ